VARVPGIWQDLELGAPVIARLGMDRILPRYTFTSTGPPPRTFTDTPGNDRSSR
jgi:hypothetical protein